MAAKMSLEKDAKSIIDYAIREADPFSSTEKFLKQLDFGNKKITVLSIGKAAVPMARAAEMVLGSEINKGLLVTKYNHAENYKSDYFTVIEAGHPVSDNNSIIAAEKALEICNSLTEKDACVVLLSGGGSALLEKSIIPAEMQRSITKRLLASGADINTINSIRRRISLVKGGRLAAAAYPARVYTIALSDVLDNDKSAIASGITVQDSTDNDTVLEAVKKYIPEFYVQLKDIINIDDEIKINDGGYYFAGDINFLCNAAEKRAADLGYEVISCSRSLEGEAREACKNVISSISNKTGKAAYIYGGETTVTLKGNGVGGRNQEMALQAAVLLNGKSDILFASVGSDGTDGPTDAAGGFADADTYNKICNKGISPEAELENNNSNYALKAADALIITGPTGTNVNDLTIILTDFNK